jgi:hypothetical protein
LRAFAREHPWWTTGVVLFLFSVFVARWAHTRPSYDAYGWLVWGYQTLHGSLDLGGAPSWKPLSFVFTVPFALFGHYQMWLWLFASVFVSLGGCIFAGRITYKLVGDDTPERRRAALAGAVFAGIALLGIEDYMHYILSAQSDPMIVGFTLAAIDMHLSGHKRWSVVFGTLAALGRPEAWIFLGPYTLWQWRETPELRRWLVGAWVLIAFFWFGIPTITNDRPFVSAQLALLSPRACNHNKVICTIGRFTELQYLPIWIAAICTLAVALWRRIWMVVALAALAVAWVIVEVAFALHGWPGLPRYVMEPAAICTVFAGVAVGWALLEAPRLRAGLPRWAGIPVVVILIGSLVPGAVARIRHERKDRTHEIARTNQINLLGKTASALGGARHIGNCGQPVTDVAYVSALAWIFHRNVGSVGGLQQHVEKAELANPAIPKVLFKPASSGGWRVTPWHTRPTQLARCAGLKAAFVPTRSHPGGQLLRGH